jgi:predicted nuclease of restriction endonuclease-like (RecB) superfamily
MANEVIEAKLQNQFDEVLTLIVSARERVFRRANKETVELYWAVGEYVSRRMESAEWGDFVVQQLAEHISQNRPDIKGFSKRGLFYMRQFYETWREYEFVPTLWAQISWSCHKAILARKTHEEREFYLRLAAKENYTARELDQQIKSDLFTRMITSKGKASLPAKQTHPDVEDAFRDTYVLNLLGLPDRHSEKDLRKAIVAHLKDFILEFGRDFCFMGEEYRLEVGGQDFFIDLLFYHRGLRCLVPFELKIGKFKPEHLGQLSFYLEALDRQVKRDDENPSVGIILCKEKDDEVVEMALSTTMSPALVADYKTKLIDNNLLKRKFHEVVQLLEADKEED